MSQIPLITDGHQLAFYHLLSSLIDLLHFRMLTGNFGTNQSIIGSLLYLMIGTRPDIAYAVTKLMQFAANPSQEHLTSAKYICHYLAGVTTYEQ